MFAEQRDAGKEHMNGYRGLFTTRIIVFGAALALTVAGCKSSQPATDDASLNTQVQKRITSDQALNGQPIQPSVSNGVVTLNGTVTSDAARVLAANDAAQVGGVKTVVNNLEVQTAPAPAAAAVTPPPMPAPVEETHGKSKQSSARQRQPAPVVRNEPAPQSTPPPQNNPPVMAENQAPPPPPPPPAPVVHNVTLAAGTSIPVRITQTLDSKTSQTGDKFTGVVATDIIEDGIVVLPQGTPVTGHVDQVQDAAHFKGSSLLSISLSSISRKGERIDVATEPYTKQGEGRGKNTAEKVGGGAAVGAILGGILGGGKGAAIGSVAGGGVGAGAQAATRGQQVQIPSESVVRFKLSNPILLHVTTGGESSQENSGPTLERRNMQ
jgi:hypothetical protein